MEGNARPSEIDMIEELSQQIEGHYSVKHQKELFMCGLYIYIQSYVMPQVVYIRFIYITNPECCMAKGVVILSLILHKWT